MKTKLDDVVNKLKNSWNSMDINSFEEIQKLIRDLALEGIDKNQDYSSKGIELYRDSELGFILNAYSEIKGNYRIPHNHGNGWVIYSVMEGAVEMGNYFNWEKSPGRSQLVLKDKSILNSGDVKIYYPGYIHDTKCLSEIALILRLTSCDLKIEETEGRMKRFDIVQKSCSL
jgi:hypothetical protein